MTITPTAPVSVTTERSHGFPVRLQVDYAFLDVEPGETVRMTVSEARELAAALQAAADRAEALGL